MKRRETLLAAAAAPISLSRPLTRPFTRGIWPSTQPPPASYRFGPDFKFGASTSAYQIEGAVFEDGRSPGIWDHFCHNGHHIADDDNADIACDHYHRMPEDVALLAQAGIPNYRFSVSWSRLFPEDGGAPNPRGFAFYSRLLDELQRHNITPWLCLYHWDLPQYLQDKGGWTNRDTAYRLADFSDRVSRYFGGRISNWMVLNEAAVHGVMGHGMGAHAPGLTGTANLAAALHHLNLGQGLSIQALRTNLPHACIGTVASCEPIRPSTTSPVDLAAAAQADAFWNGAVLDPLFLGHYPELVAADFEPLCHAGDLKNCRQKIDLLGINYYDRLHFQHNPHGPLAFTFGPNHDPIKFHAMAQPMAPDGLYEILMRVHQRYGGPQMFISENGFATVKDGKPGSGLEDDGRLAYIAANLQYLQKAVDNGANVSGYFVWSIIDNFEWNAGKKYRFGMVDVDFTTLKRTPKQSYYWYSAVLRAHAARRGGVVA